MKRLSIILLLTPILIQCTKTFETELANDPTIGKVFSPTETEDLTQILEFFESQICTIEHVEVSDIKGCYSSFFERMKKGAEEGEVPINISFDEQRNFYQQIDSSTFDQLWTFNRMWRHNSTDTLKSMGFKYDGIRWIFRRIREIEPVIYEYYDSYQQAGDISPSMVAGLLMNYEAYDISQVNIRLTINI